MPILDFFRKKPESEQFAELVIREFRKSGWPDKIEYDRSRFSLNPGKSGTSFLHNHFKSWQLAAAEVRASLVADIVASAFEILTAETEDKSFDAIRHQIWPTLRGRAYIENLWMVDGMKLDADSYSSVQAPFCEALTVILTINGTHNISICTKATFEEWKKSFAEVLPIAKCNLREQKRVWFDKQSEGYYIAETGDYYESALPLLPEAFSKLDLDGYPIAVIPTRAIVLVAGSNDISGINAMADLAVELYQNDSRPVSLLPIVMKNSDWLPFDDAASVYERLHYLRRQNTLIDNADQKLTLDDYFLRNGRDIFVPTVTSLISNDGQACLVAQVFDGIQSLLPYVDVLAIYNSSRDEVILRRFDDVMSVIGPLTVEPYTFPPRYLHEGRITDVHWSQLCDGFSVPNGLAELTFPKPSTFEH